MAAGLVSVTITGQTGPGKTVTSLAVTDVSNINFDFAGGVVKVVQRNPVPKTIEVEYSNLATVTITPSTGVVVLST